MMWEIKSDDKLDLSFTNMEPHEILYEFDSLIIFVFKVSDRLFFAYSSDEDYENKCMRFLVVSTDEKEVKDLEFGKITVYQMLNKNLVWAVDRDLNGNHLSTTCLVNGIEGVPFSNRPMPDVFLNEEEKEDKHSSLLARHSEILKAAYVYDSAINQLKGDIVEVSQLPIGYHSTGWNFLSSDASVEDVITMVTMQARGKLNESSRSAVSQWEDVGLRGAGLALRG